MTRENRLQRGRGFRLGREVQRLPVVLIHFHVVMVVVVVSIVDVIVVVPVSRSFDL